MKGDFIKLYRQLTNWEWYIDIPCKVLFLHCLLKANFTAGKFEGREIPAGSFETSAFGNKQAKKDKGSGTLGT